MGTSTLVVIAEALEIAAVAGRSTAVEEHLKTVAVAAEGFGISVEVHRSRFVVAVVGEGHTTVEAVGAAVAAVQPLTDCKRVEEGDRNPSKTLLGSIQAVVGCNSSTVYNKGLTYIFQKLPSRTKK